MPAAASSKITLKLQSVVKLWLVGPVICLCHLSPSTEWFLGWSVFCFLSKCTWITINGTECRIILFFSFQVQGVVNLFLWSSFRQTGLGPYFKLRNKPRPLYSVIALGFWIKYLEISWIKCQLFTSLVLRNYWQITHIEWIKHIVHI